MRVDRVSVFGSRDPSGLGHSLTPWGEGAHHPHPTVPCGSLSSPLRRAAWRLAAQCVILLERGDAGKKGSTINLTANPALKKKKKGASGASDYR